jgi:hypothetical protein
MPFAWSCEIVKLFLFARIAAFGVPIFPYFTQLPYPGTYGIPFYQLIFLL